MEFLIIIYEYFCVKGWRKLLIKSLLSLSFGGIIFYTLCEYKFPSDGLDLLGNTLNVLGILLGFSISIFAIIVSMDNKIIQDAKNHDLGKIILNKKISIYDTLVISFGFLILLEGLSLLLTLVFFVLFNSLIPVAKNILISLNLSVIFYIVMELLSSILGFYFVITKRD